MGLTHTDNCAAELLRRAVLFVLVVLADRLNPKISVSIVFVLAMFMAIMDITIVNVALPQLASDFSVNPDHIDLVVVSFLVSLAVSIPASGWLGDRFGTKRVLLAALLIFTGASALCGLSQSLTQLVIFRALQGVGGGMLTPVGMAMLFRTFPPAERVRASRILIVPTAFAPALGPVLGGLLVTDVSWRWVFYVNVPIGVAAFIFGVLFLHEHREPEPVGSTSAASCWPGLGLPASDVRRVRGPEPWLGVSPSIIGLGDRRRRTARGVRPLRAAATRSR